MRAVPISAQYKDYIGKPLSEVPDDLVKKSRILKMFPRTKVEADFDHDRINIILDKEGKVFYIIGG